MGQNYLPHSAGEIINHTGYSLSYDEQHEQAQWVYYELTPDDVNGDVSRTNDFRPDPKVSTRSALPDDYKGSGYDRGHLYPAGSSKTSRQAMSETFYMSNMSPQTPSFNRGIWRSLEETVRRWTTEKEKLVVVSGPVFINNKGCIGANRVTVPGYYYKVIYAPYEEKMIAFILPNQKSDQPLYRHAVTVDSVEIVTGIDFFPQMEDSKEISLEAKVNLIPWNFDAGFTPSYRATTKAVQCKGIAKSTGKRCKNKTTNPNGYCRYHQGQAGQK
ncbi:DNA/RNA non-specific endonuclease [Thermophagus sp. OGC60D27]|uniref:DNA/RNA non-specific endonuclease n=1 Tax=Thermophagus sp. OGC60D27 TaxID=3458415 RepID=UPI004037CFF6